VQQLDAVRASHGRLQRARLRRSAAAIGGKHALLRADAYRQRIAGCVV
jgi:hypothetical protein